ncbi:unnamed protein product [Gordionus sp. m RMFG-2023]
MWMSQQEIPNIPIVQPIITSRNVPNVSRLYSAPFIRTGGIHLERNAVFRQQERTLPTCFLCGRLGHKIFNCRENASLPRRRFRRTDNALAGLPKESVANTIRIPLSETGDKASTSGIRQQAHSRTSSEVQRMEELMLGQSDDENKNSNHPLGKD